MSVTKSSTAQHVAVFAFPFGTHAVPLLNLVRRLAAAARHVRFSFFSTAKINGSIFSAPTSDGFANIKTYDVWDGVPEGQLPSGNPEEDMPLFLNATPRNFKRGADEAVAETGKKITCLMSDAFLWFAAEMAEEMHVPWVALWTAGPCSVAAHVYTDLIRQAMGTDGREDDTLNFIPGMSAIQIRDLPQGVIFGDTKSPFSRMLHKMGLVLPQATAVVGNSFEELDPTITNNLKSKFQKFLSVGPLTLTSKPLDSDLNGCLLWLDKQKAASVAYLSFGTVARLPPDELSALADAIEASGFPFLWSLKDDARSQLPEGFLERTSEMGKVVPRAPQLQVLAHASTGAFVTHCGWNSVLESITGGVPMICRPFFGDQKLNRRMVEDVWKIGMRVKGEVFAKTETINALQLVLCHQEGRKMRENIGHFKGLAMKSVGLDGSSTENFKSLLDVVTTMKGI